jgi:hypothetical protein
MEGDIGEMHIKGEEAAEEARSLQTAVLCEPCEGEMEDWAGRISAV